MRLAWRSVADKPITIGMPIHSRIGEWRVVSLCRRLAAACLDSRARSVVTYAAVSFAACYFGVLATAPSSMVIASNLDAELARQLVYCAALLGRFALPLIVMVVGLMYQRSKSKMGI